MDDGGGARKPVEFSLFQALGRLSSKSYLARSPNEKAIKQSLTDMLQTASRILN